MRCLIFVGVIVVEENTKERFCIGRSDPTNEIFKSELDSWLFVAYFRLL